MDLVSVIIPVYNVEAYLDECIDSVLRQTYKNLEIILVDDGSTDRSGSICQEYALRDHRIIVIRKSNGGLSSARNAGLAAAKGKYLYFLDSDDYLEDTAVETLAERMREHPDVDFALFEGLSFSDEGAISADERDAYHIKHSYPGEYNGPDLLLRLLRTKDYRASVPLCFYKSDFFQSSGLTFHEGIVHEDEEFTLLAFMRAKKVMVQPSRLYYRRVRSGSITNSRTTLKNTDGYYQAVSTLLDQTAFCGEAAYRKGIARVYSAFLFAVSNSVDKNTPPCRQSVTALRGRMRALRYLGSPRVFLLAECYRGYRAARDTALWVRKSLPPRHSQDRR